MNPQEVTEIGWKAALLIERRRETRALMLLSPIFATRTPFRLLDRIGGDIGAGPQSAVNSFLERLASNRTEGGWVVIGSALGKQLDHDLAGALTRCRNFIAASDVWYGADILAGRVPGPGLVAKLDRTIKLLDPWREDRNRWVRRSVGVAVHFWAKRSLGLPEHVAGAETLLSFLEPMFEEQELDAIKGVGWGLKTLGKYYPEMVGDWLVEQVVHRGRHPRALIIRKSLTYLPADQRGRVASKAP